MGLLLCAALWVGSSWADLFFTMHSAWAPMGSSVFPMGSACCLMGSEALSHYLRWAPHGLLLGSCVFAGVCNGLCVGGYWASMGSSWAPVFLRVFAVGSRMGSSWAPVFLQLLVVGSRMGSFWAPVFLQVFAVGSRMCSFWAPVFCRAWCVSSKEYNSWL